MVNPRLGIILTERVLDDILQDLREAHSVLDECDPGNPQQIWTGKGVLRLKLEFVQSMLGGSSERGRRADGSRPSDQRRGCQNHAQQQYDCAECLRVRREAHERWRAA